MARVTLRREQFEREARTRGLDSQTKQARAIGVCDSIHSRAMQGKITLSGPYVLGVLLLLGDERLRRQVQQLFDVTEEMAA